MLTTRVKLLLVALGLGGLAIGLLLARVSSEAPKAEVGSTTEPVKKKKKSSYLPIGVAISSACFAAAAAAAAKKKAEAEKVAK